MALPMSMNAIKVSGPRKAAVTESSLPKMRDGYVLVKVSYVALNPTDWKHIEMGWLNHTVGCDYAGTIVKVSAGVNTPFKPGDRIAGFAHGVKKDDPESGCFAQFALVKGDTAIRIPDHVKEQDAATLGVGVMSASQGLYQALELPFPRPDRSVASAGEKGNSSILIYGGSTASGLFAIQLAKLSGMHVITTCSPRNFEKVRSFGANEVFDYHDAECGDKIRNAMNDRLLYAFDCMAEGDSPKICAEALTSCHGVAKYSGLLPVDFPRSQDDVKSHFTLGYTTIGEGFEFMDDYWAPKPADFEFGKKVARLVETLLQAGKLKTFASVREGGFDGVLSGLEELKGGRVSAEKLVYKID